MATTSTEKINPAADAAHPAQTTATAADDEYVPEEEVLEGNWQTPQVELHEVQVMSGEEEEETFWKHRAKLYRWAPDITDKDTSIWKERGLGDAKLLKHKATGKIRFLLRQEKTLKIVANHYVHRAGSFCQLRPNSGSDKIWVWSVNDFADEVKLEQFALKFGQVEQASIFKQKFEEACEINANIFRGGSVATGGDGKSIADAAKEAESSKEEAAAEKEAAEEQNKEGNAEEATK